MDSWGEYLTKLRAARSMTAAAAVYEKELPHTLYDDLARASRKVAFKEGVRWGRMHPLKKK